MSGLECVIEAIVQGLGLRPWEIARLRVDFMFKSQGEYLLTLQATSDSTQTPNPTLKIPPSAQKQLSNLGTPDPPFEDSCGLGFSLCSGSSWGFFVLQMLVVLHEGSTVPRWALLLWLSNQVLSKVNIRMTQSGHPFPVVWPALT